MFAVRTLQCKNHQVKAESAPVFRADGSGVDPEVATRYVCPYCGARATEQENGIWLTARRDLPTADVVLVSELKLGDETFPFEEV